MMTHAEKIEKAIEDLEYAPGHADMPTKLHLARCCLVLKRSLEMACNQIAAMESPITGNKFMEYHWVKEAAKELGFET